MHALEVKLLSDEIFYVYFYFDTAISTGHHKPYAFRKRRNITVKQETNQMLPKFVTEYINYLI
jgi:hypothetical protein